MTNFYKDVTICFDKSDLIRLQGDWWVDEDDKA